MVRTALRSRDFLHAYTVLIDGESVAKVRRGRAVAVPVHPGRHDVQIKISLMCSRVVAVDVPAGGEATLSCRPNGTIFQPWQVFIPGEYVALEPGMIGPDTGWQLWHRRIGTSVGMLCLAWLAFLVLLAVLANLG